MSKCAVIGAGAWGTAVGTALSRAGSEVILWALEPAVVSAINETHENSIYLAGVALPENITATNSFADILDADIIFLVSPSQFARTTCEQLLEAGVEKNVPIVICSKGVESDTLKLMTEVVAEILPNPIAVMSGPTFAKEVANALPASVTLAGSDKGVLDKITDAIESSSFKVFHNSDLIGAEIGGAVKNVIAIACGIAEGSGLGENAKAALMVRGLREMKRICEVKGGDPDTLMQLCGVGDLILTASSQESRNFSLGYKLGQGETLEDIMSKRNTVAEGVFSSKSVVALGKQLGVELPVCETVYRIVHGKEAIKETIEELVRES